MIFKPVDTDVVACQLAFCKLFFVLQDFVHCFSFVIFNLLNRFLSPSFPTWAAEGALDCGECVLMFCVECDIFRMQTGIGFRHLEL